MQTSKTPRKILILALSGIGNLMMQSPVFEAIKKQFPDCHVAVWISPRGTKALAMANPYINEVIEAPIKQSVIKHLSLVWRLAKSRFDVGIVLSPGQLWKSAAYLFLAGIPVRIGNTYPYKDNKHSDFLLTRAVQDKSDLHDLEQNLRLLEPLGIKSPENMNYVLDLPTSSVQQAHSYVQNLNIPDSKQIIGIHAGSAPGFLWKRWPIYNFIDLCGRLVDKKNAHILIFGGPGEEKDKLLIKDGLGENASVITADLLTTAAVMKQCALIISNDSGLMHIAAATGVTTIGLFGPTDEKLTGPRGLNSYVIRAPHTIPVYNTEHKSNLGDEPHRTMLEITSDLVWNTLLEKKLIS